MNLFSWVTSHLEICQKYFERYQNIVNGLLYVVDKERQRVGGEKSVEKAEELLNFASDRNALVSVVFNLDIQEIFSTSSKVFQKTLSTLIGQTDRDYHLVTQLNLLKRFGGIKMSDFIKQCKCGLTRDTLVNCNNLIEYETSEYVEYQDLELKKDLDYPTLSDFRDNYIDDMVKEISEWFPKAGNVNRGRVDPRDFDALNQALWPSKRDKIQGYKPESIEKLAKLFDVPYSASLQDEFNTLVKTILDEATADQLDTGHLSDPVLQDASLDEIAEQDNVKITQRQRLFIFQQENFYCNYKKSNPVYFWQVVLRKFPTSQPLEKLIKSAIVIPLGSADAERSFSELNLIKTKHKSSMKIPQINSDLNINLNGQKVTQFVPKNYLSYYSQHHDKCDVELNSQKAKKTLKGLDQREAEQRVKSYFLSKTTYT